jgi:RNA polymerase sigma factor (sigma-70 family)
MTERMSTRASNTGERHAALVRTIAERRSDFVAFVRKRVQDAATAEDIVSETLARAVFRANDLRDENALAAWLYRALRNAVVDHHRRRAATGRALAGLSREASLEAQRIHEGPALGRACPCVQKVAAALKPEYAQALERIEVEGTALRAFAAEVGISTSNAAVRVFRARDALRRAVVATCGGCARDRCVDCTCGPSRSRGVPFESATRAASAGPAPKCLREHGNVSGV